MMIKVINGILLRKMVLNGAHLLEQNKQHVDALNVFPVPDGDTGTNMALTMQSAAKELTSCPTNNIEDVCSYLSKGALRGARGNSGVILSQIIKGMCNEFSQVAEITPKVFSKALVSGAEIAYKAVTKPKEGTILTIIRCMGEFAQKLNKRGLTMTEFLNKVIESGEATLKQTPDMLDVLKKAGVVDAGGRGLLIMFQGMCNALEGKEETLLEFDDKAEALEVGAADDAHLEFAELSDIEFAYCTEFFVVNLLKKTTEADIDRFRQKLMTIGDCVLVIGDLSMVKVHVHTNQPGVALSYALELGELDKLKIENMLEQFRALKNKSNEALKKFGMVAVCAGDGLAAIFKDILVDNIISGGQTMNPSAEDIALACDRVPAEHVFVFPNNKNIILAADQAKNLSKRTLHIIPTTNIPEGISSVLAFNPEDELEDNIANMNSAVTTVKAGLVTYASRTTQVDSFDVKKGDIIGLDNSSIVAKGQEVKKVTKDLVDKMMRENGQSEVSNITLYFGNNVKEDEANAIAYELSKEYKKCDVDIQFGGQPVYYYIVSLD